MNRILFVAAHLLPAIYLPYHEIPFLKIAPQAYFLSATLPG